MLVMHTLYNSLEQRLPVDSHFKMIDLWLMHGLYVPFFVFCIHIAAKLLKDKNGRITEDSKAGNQSTTTRREISTAEINDQNKRGVLLRVTSILFPTFSALFVLCFFMTGLSIYATSN